MGTRIPHLPEELHLLIGQFISRNDLPNYRLASKSCCAIITPELFGTLTFHFSTGNLERLRHIADNEHLRKNVKTLFFDINLWRIPNVRDYHEWKAYFLAKANSPWTAPSEGQRVRYESLAMDRPEWEAYLDKMIDEGKVRDSDRLLEVLEQFHNVQAIHIVHGTLNPAHRGVKKMSDQVDSISEKAIVLHRGEGVNDRHSRAGQDALRFLPQLTCPRLRKLRLDRIHYTSFHYISPDRPPGSFLDSLRSLDLRITSRSDRPDGMYYKSWAKSRLATRVLRQGRLKLFLMGLRQLECLKIDLNCYEQRWPEYQPMSCVQDAFGSDSVWPRLRKLSLTFFFATPNSLVDLCQRHSSTLKDLRLCNIFFSSNEREQASSFEVPDPEQKSVMTPEQLAWLNTLESLGEILDLERATVSGKLGVSTPYEKAWNLDDDPLLAAAVSGFLVRGGHCPLYDAPWI